VEADAEEMSRAGAQAWNSKASAPAPLCLEVDDAPLGRRPREEMDVAVLHPARTVVGAMAVIEPLIAAAGVARIVPWIVSPRHRRGAVEDIGEQLPALAGKPAVDVDDLHRGVPGRGYRRRRPGIFERRQLFGV
jgi:hypothetical protein